jgi:dihydrofolate synthase / folylpolyglutamate synthase
VDYAAAIEFVEAHIDYGTWAARSGRTSDVELSLDRMVRFVELLGNPHHSLPVIHVTGTNGKGSTSRIITRLLMAEGLRVATYSSPHLERYNERFRVNDADISNDELAGAITVAAAAEEQLGERLMPFEVLTGAALLWFASQDVDVAVIEVGVLGRFDATNVCDGRVAVVTNIGFDHTNGAGDWQQRIAAEKAGVVKPSCTWFGRAPTRDRVHRPTPVASVVPGFRYQRHERPSHRCRAVAVDQHTDADARRS